jgi:cell wall-associated NlpC family hydrolase
MAAAGLPIAKSELAPGDLVFFNTLGRSFSHVGVYLGEGRFLHASSSKRQVMLNSLNERYFVERFDGARRVVR